MDFILLVVSFLLERKTMINNIIKLYEVAGIPKEPLFSTRAGITNDKYFTTNDTQKGENEINNSQLSTLSSQLSTPDYFTYTVSMMITH